MQKYGIITLVPFSKYASPIFAQRKLNGKLRFLVDLRKVNSLKADDYIKNNHPVSTMTDAAQHFSGKSLLWNLDCSQASHCLQMADQRSVKMWKCLHSILQAKHLPTKNLHEVSADLCLPFQVSCVSIWTQLSKLTNVFTTSTTLEMQLINPRTLPGTFGQS